MKSRIPAAVLSLALCASLAAPAAALELSDARELLESHYIDPLPNAALEATTLEDLLAALNDPYTVYYTAEEYASFLDSVHGESVVGIGVSIQTAFSNGFEVLSVLPNSPALEAGLKAGDKIIAVDGHVLSAQSNISGLLTGIEGTEVAVTVRLANGGIKDLTMIRKKVQIPIVNSEKRGTIGFIDCDSFGNSTADDVSFPLASLDSRVTVWAMDLRTNPGGTSDSAALTASHFLGGRAMVFFRDGQGKYYTTWTNPYITDMTDKPLIIWTSTNSASAAELFSGAIRDHCGGISIGQRTYGKGIAQLAFDQNSYPELFQGDALKVTSYQFFSPNGMTCHLVGILPSLMTDEPMVEPITELLSSPAPVRAQGWMKLKMGGHSFYLDPQKSHDSPAVLTALLEALPPDAQFYRGYDLDDWTQVTALEVAQWKKLDNYQPRTFSDIEGHKYQYEINTLATYGLLAGDGAGNFLPEETLTRAQLCAMLSAALNLPAAENTPAFPDVSLDAWYADAVSTMTARGFLSGTDRGTFEPDALLTNQELYTILSGIAAWCSMKGDEMAQSKLTAPQWAEFYAYPEWAQTCARNLAKLGLDVDRENPTATVSRGEAAGLLCQLMENLGMFWY